MSISNLEIRQQITSKRIKYYELAAALKINPCTLSHWLQTELTEERKKKILKAINDFKY